MVTLGFAVDVTTDQSPVQQVAALYEIAQMKATRDFSNPAPATLALFSHSAPWLYDLPSGKALHCYAIDVPFAQVPPGMAFDPAWRASFVGSVRSYKRDREALTEAMEEWIQAWVREKSITSRASLRLEGRSYAAVVQYKYAMRFTVLAPEGVLSDADLARPLTGYDPVLKQYYAAGGQS